MKKNTIWAGALLITVCLVSKFQKEERVRQILSVAILTAKEWGRGTAIKTALQYVERTGFVRAGSHACREQY